MHVLITCKHKKDQIKNSVHYVRMKFASESYVRINLSVCLMLQCRSPV